MNRYLFMDKIGENAYSLWGNYKILPSIIIAHSVIQSSWGSSVATAKAKNPFNIQTNATDEKSSIVVKNWYGETIRAKIYTDWKESMEDFLRLFTRRYPESMGETDLKKLIRYLTCYVGIDRYDEYIEFLILNYDLPGYDEPILNHMNDDMT